MEAVIIVFATALLTIVCGSLAMVILINFGIFPVPDEDQFVHRLYWRSRKAGVRKSTVTIVIVSNDNLFFNEERRITSTSNANLTIRKIPSNSKPYYEFNATATGESKLVRA